MSPLTKSEVSERVSPADPKENKQPCCEGGSQDARTQGQPLGTESGPQQTTNRESRQGLSHKITGK